MNKTQCSHASIATCSFPSMEHCPYNSCPGVEDDKIIDFIVTCNRTFIECENHDLVWDTISKCEIGDTIKVHSPTEKNCSVFSPFHSLNEKVVNIDSATLGWLEEYTWIQDDAEESYDFTSPRHRPSDLPLTDQEMVMVGSVIASEKEAYNFGENEEVIVEVLNNNVSPPKSHDCPVQNGEEKEIVIHSGVSILNIIEQEKKGDKKPVLTPDEVETAVKDVMGNANT